MRSREHDWKRFARLGGSVLTGSLAVAVVLSLVWWPSQAIWAAFGVLACGGTGLIGAVRMVQVHGTATGSFLLAMILTQVARVLLVGAGAVAATFFGTEAVFAYLVGAACGFLPLTTFETIWFVDTTSAAVRSMAAEETYS